MKAFTDIEESKKLAKILPIESADMTYDGNGLLNVGCVTFVLNHRRDCTPCWSLAALLEQIPSDIKTKDGYSYTLEIEKCDAEHLPCGLNYHDTWGRGEDIISHYYDNYVDACVDLIIRLKEKDLI